MGILRITIDRKTLQETKREFIPNDKEPHYSAFIDATLPELIKYLDEIREKQLIDERIRITS